MARVNPNQRVQVESIQTNNWQLGIWSSAQSEEIPDQAAQDIENFEFDDDSNLRTRTGVANFLSTSFTSRITSIFRAEYSNGTVFILFTTANQLYRCDEDGDNITNITGSLTLPSDVPWQWAMFDDLAIGVNGATTGDNPVKVDSSGTAAALGGSPPRARYLEVWNNRLWLVRAETTDLNSVRGSALGSAEDWTIDDDAGSVEIVVDANDGDRITGIKEFRNSLFVFKRKKINVISAQGSPATIPGNLRVDIYTRNLGCISPYSIQTVLDDVIFLSNSGVASLTQSEYGELKSAILSSKVIELSRIKKGVDFITAFVLDDANQYWLSIPANASPRNIPEVYVLHYDKIAEGLVRWTRFTGAVCGFAYGEKLDGDYKEYLIASQGIGSGSGALWDSALWDVDSWDASSPVFSIYKYQPLNPIRFYNDVFRPYTKQVKTKAFSADQLFVRKNWQRFQYGLRLLTSMLGVLTQYYFNNDPNQSSSYTFNFTLEGDQPLWDMAQFDANSFEGSSERDAYVDAQFRRNSRGRIGLTVTFIIGNNVVDQAFTLKYFALDYITLTDKRIGTRQGIA